MTDKTLIETVAAHLIKHGSITRVTAMAEYGHFHLGDVIHRLRGPDKDLLPANVRIETHTKKAVSGRPYSEYRLVPEAA
jgi:hypothetical protein